MFFPSSAIVFIFFLNALPSAKYVNFVCSIILLCSDGNIPSPIRYAYLSILPDYNPDIFAASLLILYCSFSSLILLSIAMINFYVLFKRFSLKREELSDARVVPINKNKYVFPVNFL